MPTCCPNATALLRRPIRRHRAEPWGFQLSAKDLVQTVAGTLEIPKDGWTAATFARDGVRLIRAINRLALITQRKAVPVVARKADEIFRRQLREVIAIATGTAGRSAREFSAKTELEIMFPSHEALWMQAINRVFEREGLDIITEMTPPIQSVMAQGYSRTSLLLGDEVGLSAANAAIAREARGLAAKITRINVTTRNLFERVIRSAIEEGQTVAETARTLSEKLPAYNASRQMTIARTELSAAWTQGSARSFKESSTVTQVSIIGCQEREPNSPQWNGQSTCNYEDLPVTDIDAFLDVGFHPNHTGTMVPTGFRDV
jgi:hypothetical protein